MIQRPPRYTRPDTLVPYTTRCRTSGRTRGNQYDQQSPVVRDGGIVERLWRTPQESQGADMGAGQHGQHGFVGNGQDASAGAYAGGPGHDQPPDMVGDVARQVLAELAGGQNWGRYRARRMPGASAKRTEERRGGKGGVSKGKYR